MTFLWIFGIVGGLGTGFLMTRCYPFLGLDVETRAELDRLGQAAYQNPANRPLLEKAAKEQGFADFWNPQLAFSLCGAVLGGLLALGSGMLRGAPLAAGLGFVAGAFCGAGAGWLGGYLAVQSFGKIDAVEEQSLHAIQRVLIAHLIGWSLVGLGVGVGLSVGAGKEAAPFSHVPGSILGGLLGGVLFAPLAAIVSQWQVGGNADFLVPVGYSFLYLWTGLPGVLIGACAELRLGGTATKTT